jgi:cytidylate kinase
MYRAVALAGIRAGIRLDDQVALRQLLGHLDLRMREGAVLLDGKDVSGLIRTPEVSSGASVVAASAVVRQDLVKLQRAIASGRDMVCEGRDQGTVVFPDSGCKFFLTADPEERFRRRLAELKERGENADEEALRKAQEERDQRDSSRELAPLKKADDSIEVNSTHLTLAQVVERMEREVRRRKGQSGDG